MSPALPCPPEDSVASLPLHLRSQVSTASWIFLSYAPPSPAPCPPFLQVTLLLGTRELWCSLLSLLSIHSGYRSITGYTCSYWISCYISCSCWISCYIGTPAPAANTFLPSSILRIAAKMKTVLRDFLGGKSFKERDEIIYQVLVSTKQAIPLNLEHNRRPDVW